MTAKAKAKTCKDPERKSPRKDRENQLDRELAGRIPASNPLSVTQTIDQCINKGIFKPRIRATVSGKNEIIFPGSFCSWRMDKRTLRLKPALPVTTMRPAVAAFRCFHASSPG
ncbi:MAG: hypothetical protein WBG11_07825 [Methylocella sp.]